VIPRTEGYVRAVGLDPGASTGIVCLDLVPTLRLLDARWVGYDLVRPSAMAIPAERDADFSERIQASLEHFRPQLLVLEEPVDAAVGWGGRGKIKQRRGTAFRLGCAYGLAVRAGRLAGAQLVSYCVGDRKGTKGGRATKEAPARLGWLAGRKSDTALGEAIALARYLNAPPDFLALTGGQQPAYKYHDCLMALGVLAFHCARHRPTAPTGQRTAEVIE